MKVLTQITAKAIILAFTFMLANAVLITSTSAVAQTQQAAPQATPLSNQLGDLFADEPEFLPVDDAFAFDFRQKNDKLILIWNIADEYYLYRDKIKFAGIDVTIGDIKYPSSQIIEDEFFGKTNVYYHQLVLSIPLSDIKPGASVKVRYQGCAEKGFCYPPTKKEVPVDPVNAASQSTEQSTEQATESLSAKSDKPALAEHAQLADKLNNSDFLATLLVFFVLGVGLAFTPCVFPMYPILSSIIVGQGEKLSLIKAFTLSMAYVQGMAITYAGLGLVVASMGVKFQAYFQHPAVLITISVLFVLLALSMFGVYNISLPEKWQSKISNVSNSQKGGSIGGVFIMGVLSGLIASPCTTAPLSGALLFVAQSGDLFTGGITLYILSLGMGLPLIIIGTTGGKLLPKAGNWMNIIKHIFGFILLFVPLILLERIIPFNTIVYAALAIMIAFAAYLHYEQSAMQQSKAKTALWMTSILMIVGSIYATTSLTQPKRIVAANDGSHAAATASLSAHDMFIKVKNLAELKEQLEVAKSNNKYVMFDLYADWCVACKEFEQFTFSDAQVQNEMSQMHVLQADLTASNDEDIALMEAYMVFGLPTILFFAPNGEEVSSHRVTGFKNATEFTSHLKSLRK